MDTNRLYFEAIALRKCIRATYNRMTVILAPHILFTRHDELFIDAVTLGTLLNESASVPDALRAYQRRRALRTQAERVASRATLGLASMTRGARVRDRVVHAALWPTQATRRRTTQEA